MDGSAIRAGSMMVSVWGAFGTMGISIMNDAAVDELYCV